MRSAGSSWLLWIAQGFGVGRIPFAPGTWGSLLGILWAWAVLLPGGPGAAWTLTLVGIFVAVPICAAGERILGRRDPGSVVLDEIVVLPLVWLPALTLTTPANEWSRLSTLLLQSPPWISLACGFVAFRVFDIWKPGPIRISQRLVGGWGVVADDVLAASVASAVPFLLTWMR